MIAVKHATVNIDYSDVITGGELISSAAGHQIDHAAFDFNDWPSGWGEKHVFWLFFSNTPYITKSATSLCTRKIKDLGLVLTSTKVAYFIVFHKKQNKTQKLLARARPSEDTRGAQSW